MRKKTFQPLFNFCNNEKPKMSTGDISIDSLSNNDSQDEKQNNSINEISYDFPKENKIISINISNNINNNNDSSISYNNRYNNIRGNINININDFNMLKRSTWSKENNRYNNNISEMYDDNLKFLSFCDNDYNDEDDDIVNIVNSDKSFELNNNKKSTDYVKGFNALYNIKNDNEVEIVLHPDISKIYSSGEISDYKNEEDNINNENSNRFLSKENKSISENKIENNNKEVNVELNQNDNKTNNINNIDNSNNIIKNHKNQDLKESKNFNESQKKKTLKILSLTKQKKIFQKFLSVSVDTSGLYSLDDEMQILLLNPKIIYNYPYNKKERELE